MAKNNISHLALEFVESFDGFKKNKKTETLYNAISKEGELTSTNLEFLFSDIKNVSQTTNDGAVVSGRTLRKTWNSLNLLSRKNISLERKNFTLKRKILLLEKERNELREKMERIENYVKRLSDQF